MLGSISALRSVVAIVASSLVAAFAHAQAAPAASECGDFPCGRVETIVQVTVKDKWTPLGTTGTMSPGSNSGQVATSFEFGPGLTNNGMVLLGAAGGAVYRKTPNSYEKPQWQVTVKLDNGRTRVLTLAYEPYVREGDRVRVAGNNVELID
jgi:outer membrane lipoprotein SlyB